MDRDEATRLVQARFDRDYAGQVVTHNERAGYVRREVARLLGEPVPRSSHVRRRRRAKPVQVAPQSPCQAMDDLEKLLSRSLVGGSR